MNKTFHPLVSIVIPVYNGSNYLSQAIDSALKQTYKNIEIIVINDGSSDDGATAKIAKSYGKKIRYFEKPNGGVATALNMGIQKMRGEYFSWLSHDDLYRPDKINSQIKYINQHKNKSEIIFSDFTYIDKDKKVLSRAKITDTNAKNIFIKLISTSPIHGCSLLIPRKCFPSKNPFDHKLRVTQDYDLWFRMAPKCRFIHLPKSLVYSRVHGEQDTLKRTDIVKKENIQLYNKYIGQIRRIYNKTDIGDLREMYLECAFGLVDKYFFPSADLAFSLYLKTQPSFVKKMINLFRFNWAKLHLLATASIGYISRKIRKSKI